MAKKIEINDFFTKIICILISAMLWLYVVYTEKPEDDLWLRGIPVTLINAKELEGKGMVVLSGEEQKVDIQIKGDKNVIAKVKPSDVIAKIDLSKIDAVGTLTPEAEVSVHADGVSVSQKKHAGPVLVIDSIAEKKLKIEAQLTGEAKEDSVVSIKNIIPSVVKVKGPSKIVEELTAITEPLSVENLEGTGTVTQGVILKDAKGNVVENKNVELELSSVALEYEVTAKKAVEVQVKTEGTNHEYNVEIEKFSPSKIEINGDEAKLQKVDSVFTKPIDISQMTEDCIKETEVILEEGVYASEDAVHIEVIFKVTPKVADGKDISPRTEKN